MSTPIRTTLTEQHFQFLRDSGSIVYTGRDKEFYFLPFWFEKCSPMSMNFIMHRLGELPEELVTAISDRRNALTPISKEVELDAILDKLELGTISASEAKPKIKSLFV